MPDLTRRGNSNVLAKSFVDWYNTARPVLARREVLVRYGVWPSRCDFVVSVWRDGRLLYLGILISMLLDCWWECGADGLEEWRKLEMEG